MNPSRDTTILKQKTHRIEKAFNELSQEAFAIWIRLMMASPKQLKSGRTKLAEMTNYSEGRFSVILKELKNNGYVTIHPGPYPGTPSEIKLTRKALIAGKNHFVILANCLTRYGPNNLNATQHEIQAIETVRDLFSFHALQLGSEETADFHNIVRRKWLSIDSPYETSEPAKDTETPESSSEENMNKHSANAGAASTSAPAATKNSSRAVSKRTPKFKAKSIYLPKDYPKKRHDLQRSSGKVRENVEEETQDAKSVIGISSSSNFRREKILKKKKDINKAISDKRKKTREENARRREQLEKDIQNGKGLAAGWDAPDDATITFDPFSKHHAWMKEVILRKWRADPERVALLEKIGTEFRRVYSKYRKLYDSEYDMHPIFGKTEFEMAKRAGIHCVLKGVTPTELIEYWHIHARDFTKLIFPTIHFLSGAANVETVACIVGGRRGAKRAKSLKGEERASVEHTFSDLSELDRRLRKGLEKAGFDTGEYDDRYLLSVQSAARSRARGFDLFVPESMAGMVEWATKNLYHDLEKYVK